VLLTRLLRLAHEFRRMPRVTIDLMAASAASNDPFYHEMVKRYHATVRRRHPKYLFIRQMVHGVALCRLPGTFDEYFMRVEGSARRNYKKAVREGCAVRRIQFNDHLEQIREIRLSADVRQGRQMPEAYRRGVVTSVVDPPSRSPLHDYPYFGVFLRDKLVGYAGCMVAGELCSLEHILGHADYLSVGGVPQLIIGIAQHLYHHHPQVRYYSYGMYFGGGEGLRRFKRKFDFLPHRVDWVLGEEPAGAIPAGSGGKA